MHEVNDSMKNCETREQNKEIWEPNSFFLQVRRELVFLIILLQKRRAKCMYVDLPEILHVLLSLLSDVFTGAS